MARNPPPQPPRLWPGYVSLGWDPGGVPNPQLHRRTPVRALAGSQESPGEHTGRHGADHAGRRALQASQAQQGPQNPKAPWRCLPAQKLLEAQSPGTR